MIPETLLGLAVFAAAVGPGYLYVRATEQYAPREERTTLREASELVFVGAIASGIAALLVLVLGELTNGFDTEALAADRSDYLITEPLRSLGALLAFFLLSYGGAWAVAQVQHRGRQPLVGEGPVWRRAFSEYRPVGCAVWTTVELRDGRKLAGSLRGYSWGRNQPRELMLWEPILVQAATAKQGTKIDDRFLIVKDDDITYVSGRYLPGNPPQP